MKRRGFLKVLTGLLTVSTIPVIASVMSVQRYVGTRRVIYGPFRREYSRGVILPPATGETTIIIRNDGTKPLQVYGSGWKHISEYNGYPVPFEFGSIESFAKGSGKLI